ncbi:hypothetical protein, partial [Vibrio cholerae]|uniref:hypothetical protein n=1 Tax=Vibrio cholerae TaxID=666 RepID=UPI001C8D4552
HNYFLLFKINLIIIVFKAFIDTNQKPNPSIKMVFCCNLTQINIGSMDICYIIASSTRSEN